MLMADDFEWNIYQNQMNDKIKQRYIRDIRNPKIAINNVKQSIMLPTSDFLDDDEIDYDFA